MATLAISKEFLRDYARLERPIQTRVQELITQFRHDSRAPKLHLEQINGSADRRARTVRVTDYWRGVVAAPERGDTFVLVAVKGHDEAIKWCKRNRFTVNQLTGALEVLDLETVEAVAEPEGPAIDGVLAERRDKDFVQLGIDSELLPLIRRLGSHEEVEAFASLLPTDQGDALTMLAAGYSVEEASAELLAREPAGPVDPDDLGAAAGRPASGSMFYVVAGADDLAELLNRPLGFWRVFLHPSQRRLVEREVYRGPAQVLGGAGTGKTVVLLHRARWLAERLPDDGSRILVTTFTRNLAQALEEALVELAGPSILDRIDVLHADSMANRVVREARGGGVAVLSDAEQTEIWRGIATDLQLPYTPTFLRQEWEQVVLGQRIQVLAGYLSAPRAGRGVRLSRAQRAQLWAAFEAFTAHLERTGQRTFLQLAHEAADHLSARSDPPYRHVLVDEAQDLHPAQWRLLRASVAEGENDIFLVGDTHQRIYDHRVRLSTLGIKVRGRSFRLRLNYRTTHEILRWSLGILRGERFDDMDGAAGTLAGYRSELHGPEPTVRGYVDAAAETAALVEAVRGWLERGVPPGEVGVAARVRAACDRAVEALKEAGIAARLLGPDERAGGDEVCVGTMHRMKGLEFRCLAAIDVGAHRVPHPRALTPENEDPVQRRHDLQRERCLLYVACSRARDDLVVSWHGEPSPFVAPLLPAAIPEA